MPHRKLVQIGRPAPPPPAGPSPTVAQYFRDLARRQGEDIRMLKHRAEEKAGLRSSGKSTREESWRLHPVVAKTAPPKKRKTAKKKSAARPALRKKSAPKRRP